MIVYLAGMLNAHAQVIYYDALDAKIPDIGASAVEEVYASTHVIRFGARGWVL